VFHELNPFGDKVVERPASLNFDIELAGKVFAGSGEDDEGTLCAIEMSKRTGVDAGGDHIPLGRSGRPSPVRG
jgi:hypothetical protein